MVKFVKESRSPILGRGADVGVEVQGEAQVQGRHEVQGEAQVQGEAKVHGRYEVRREGADVGVRAEVRGGSKVQSNS